MTDLDTKNGVLSEAVGATDFDSAVAIARSMVKKPSIGAALFRMYDACAAIQVGPSGVGEELNSPGAMRALVMSCGVPLGQGGFPLGAARDMGDWQEYSTAKKFDQRFSSACGVRLTSQQRKAVLYEIRGAERDVQQMEPMFHTQFDRVLRFLEDLKKEVELFPGTDILQVSKDEGLNLENLPFYFNRMRDLLIQAQLFREGRPSAAIYGYWNSVTAILIEYQALVEMVESAPPSQVDVPSRPGLSEQGEESPRPVSTGRIDLELPTGGPDLK